MMKISLVDGPTQRRLIVEGKVITPWAAELRTTCEDARVDLGGRELVVEMKHVTTMPQLGDCSRLRSSVFCEPFGAGRRNCCLPSIQWSTNGMTQSERLCCTDQARRSWDRMQRCRLG